MNSPSNTNIRETLINIRSLMEQFALARESPSVDGESWRADIEKNAQILFAHFLMVESKRYSSAQDVGAAYEAARLLFALCQPTSVDGREVPAVLDPIKSFYVPAEVFGRAVRRLGEAVKGMTPPKS